jgi:drug/metabolite transporter (DMT)-like permease
MAILGERFSGTVWLAMLMMFAGLFLVQPRPAAPVAADRPLGQDAA